MVIPVGLIAALLESGSDPRDEAAALQYASVEQAYEFERDQEKIRRTGAELWDACTGPTGCLLVLADNEWAKTEIDHVTVQPSVAAAAPAGAGYRESADPLGPGPHGFIGVCPGRHTIRTMVRGHAIETAVVLAPGEAMFRRLDPTARAWTSFDRATEEQLLGRLGAGQLTLLHYFEHVGDPRIKAMVGKPSSDALAEAMVYVRATLAAIASGDEETAMKRVAIASKLLVGAPIRSFAQLTSFIGFHAFDLVSKRKPREGWLFLQAGLAMLPEDPTLLAALGEIQVSNGAVEEGKGSLRRALERPAALDPALKARVERLLA